MSWNHLVNVHSGLVIGVDDATAVEPGSPLQAQVKQPNRIQLWNIQGVPGTGWCWFANVYDENLVMEVNGANGFQSGSTLQLGTKQIAESQYWRLVIVPGNHYENFWLQSFANDLVISVTAGSALQAVEGMSIEESQIWTSSA